MSNGVAIYARVSTERQAEQQTIEQQLARLRAYAAERGWPLDEAQVYRDAGYSGARLNRPGLDRLRDAVARGAVGTLLVTRRVPTSPRATASRRRSSAGRLSCAPLQPSSQ